MTVAYEMHIEEREGLLRRIVLRGRSLPFSGVNFGTRQRTKITYFAGNPVGHLDVMGPEWTPTTMNGKWNDVHLFDPRNSATLNNFPGITQQAQPAGLEVQGATFTSGGSVPSQAAKTARALRDAMMSICRGGAHLRVEWASIVRYGVLREFSHVHRAEEDLEWEAHFDWTGDTENQPVPAPERLDLTSILRQIIDRVTEVIDRLNDPLFRAEVWVRELSGLVTKLGQLIEEILGTLERVANLALTPLEVLGTIRASFAGIILAANDMIDVFERQSAVVVTSPTGDPAQIAIDNAVQYEIRRLLARLAAEGRIATERVERFDSPRIKTVVTISAGVTLRDVAEAQLGAANHWREIADFNGVSSPVLPPGTVVRVPVP